MASLDLRGMKHVVTKYLEADNILVDIEPLQACTGAGCPCSKVNMVLPQLLQSAAETRKFNTVASMHRMMYTNMFIKLAAPLMRVGHVHGAALYIAEAYYRCPHTVLSCSPGLYA